MLDCKCTQNVLKHCAITFGSYTQEIYDFLWWKICRLNNLWNLRLHYRRPIGDRDTWSEDNIPCRWPSCLIGDPSETDILDWRPIEDRHACGVQSEFKYIYLNILIFIYILLIYIGWCKESIITHVNLRWVSDQPCRSPMGLQLSLSSSPMGLRSGMPVSDGSPIWYVGLRWVSARSSIIIIFSFILYFFLRILPFFLRCYLGSVWEQEGGKTRVHSSNRNLINNWLLFQNHGIWSTLS